MKNRTLSDRLLRSSAALPLLIASPAFAASPGYDWSGFYAGLTAGATWSKSHETTSLPCNEALGRGYLCAAGSPGEAPALRAALNGSYSNTAFTGGAEGGYNWQSGAAVYGAELDLQKFRGASKSTTLFATGAGFAAGTPMNLNSSTNADWLFTARGRLGYAFNSLLVYGTGGLAVTTLSTNFTYSDANTPPGQGNWSHSETKVGWVAGGGAEWKLSQAWSAKIEYLYVKLGSATAAGAITNPAAFGYANAVSTSADLTAQIARVGVNYKF